MLQDASKHSYNSNLSFPFVAADLLLSCLTSWQVLCLKFREVHCYWGAGRPHRRQTHRAVNFGPADKDNLIGPTITSVHSIRIPN